MRWRYIINITGILIFSIGACMVLPLLVGLYYGDASIHPFAVSMIIMARLAVPFLNGEVDKLLFLCLNQPVGMALAAIVRPGRRRSKDAKHSRQQDNDRFHSLHDLNPRKNGR